MDFIVAYKSLTNGNLAMTSIFSFSFADGSIDPTNCNASRQDSIFTPLPASLESKINDTASSFFPTWADIMAFETAVLIEKLESGSALTELNVDSMKSDKDRLPINLGNSVAITFSDDEWPLAVVDFNLCAKSTMRANSSWLAESMLFILHNDCRKLSKLVNMNRKRHSKQRVNTPAKPSASCLCAPTHHIAEPTMRSCVVHVAQELPRTSSLPQLDLE